MPVVKAPEINIRQLSSDLAVLPQQIHKAVANDAALDLAPGAWVNFGNLVVRGYALAEIQIFANADNKTINFSIATWGEPLQGATEGYGRGPQGRVRYDGSIVSGVPAKANINPITGAPDPDDSWWEAESAPQATYPASTASSPVSVVPTVANQVALYPVSFVVDLLGVYALVVHVDNVAAGKVLVGCQLGF